jgi:hypothetical protein
VRIEPLPSNVTEEGPMEQIKLEDRGDRAVVTGPYRLMKEVYPKLKGRGWRYDPGERSWWYPLSKLTPRKRKLVEKLLGPYLEPRKSPKEKTLDELARRKLEHLWVSIPYELRDEAKKRGGIWDRLNKQWYMPDEASQKEVRAIARAYEQERAKEVARRYEERREKERQSEQERRKREQERLKPGPGERIVRFYGRSRHDGPRIGHTFRERKTGDVVTVVRVESEYYEDGLSFGMPEDEGWLHKAYVRPAEAEQTTQVEKGEEKEKSRARATRRRRSIQQYIQRRGTVPSGDHQLGRERLLIQGARLIPYGGGSWFAVQPGKAVWFVQNNGADGDDWSRNNVLTAGAGAIGWKVPYNEKMAQEIRELDKIIGER